MKQYEVEVMEGAQHGIHGKERYFGLVLSTNSCKAAESFAEDVVRDMTFEEFFERLMTPYSEFRKKQFMAELKLTENEDGTHSYTYIQHKLSDKIEETHSFTFKARVFRG